jgi:hypothetical protein
LETQIKDHGQGGATKQSLRGSLTELVLKIGVRVFEGRNKIMISSLPQNAYITTDWLLLEVVILGLQHNMLNAVEMG